MADLPRFLRYLKTQIILAIMLLTGLFAASAIYSMHVIDRLRCDQAMLQLAGRLQYHQQHMSMQAMQYKENAPRDYASYFRDLGLYFQDLKHSRAELSVIIQAFANNDFRAALPPENALEVAPVLPERTRPAAARLAETWRRFIAQLEERIGDNSEEPRLESAAEWISEQNDALERDSGELVRSLQSEIEQRARRAQALNRLMLIAAVLVAAGITFWFYARVLKPMGTAARGFDKVANGDFAYQVPLEQDNELGSMVASFNRLSQRLAVLRQLLTRLEEREDIAGTLKTLSDTLPALMPVDWIGVLIVGPDGRIHLQKAFNDGESHPIGLQTYFVDKTLLAECIATKQPLHIADVPGTADLSPNYRFLKKLAELGRRDAIFLPIGNGVDVQGVTVFASRFPNSYRTEHMELLQNIGVLVGASLGRTVQLVERSRLANIGGFASSIVHEIRNPLATISLALEHVCKQSCLPEGTIKRVSLANSEVGRLERLLSDILLYAKPLTLNREPADLPELLRESLAATAAHGGGFDLDIQPCPEVMIDADRLRQALINLLRNAQQASPPDQAILVSCTPEGNDRVTLTVSNAGDPIPAEILDRIFEPFVTSKRSGTGLGLPIVRRIVHGHGGEITIAQNGRGRIVASMQLPRAGSVKDGP